MAKNILKEAIADAKAVREVALANAKAALEEAFTPKLQSMLSAKLSETLNEEEDEEEVDLDEMMGTDDEDTIEEMDMDADDVEGDLDEEIDLEEILNELELDDDDSEDMMEEEELDEDNLNENFDLDKLLEDINSINEGQCKNCGADDTNENFWGIFHKHPHKKGSHKSPRHLEGDNHDVEWDQDMIDRSYMNEGPEIFTAMAGLAGLFGAAGITSALQIAVEDPSFREKHPKAAEALEKIFGFMQKIGADTGKGIGKDVKEGTLKNYVKDMAYDELRESRKALRKVKSELNEVNLLNSKLLYVNRIFKANTLDEGQKLRVVETLDKAGSVKEAKLIYETIKDSFNISKTRKTNRTPKKSIREGFGMASKAAGISTAPKKPILNESNDMVARMQKLANIKINQ